MTEKLYDSDAFLQSFTAQVTGCTAKDGLYYITLDRTAFYPEGGGQPADHGTLEGVAVIDAHERDGEILHTCTAPLTVGQTVTGTLDWTRRFDCMQQHTGEHLVSGLICQTFSCDNVGFHMGADCVTIDFNTVLSWEQVQDIEALANTLIYQNKPILTTLPSAEELAVLPYRSKKALTGEVRIVTIPEADCCACCGTHVATLGQVGLVKFLSCTNFRDGVRLELLCGKRALQYLSRTWEQNLQIAQSLSAKPLESATAVLRLQGERNALAERVAQLEGALFARVAQSYDGAKSVLHFAEELSSDSLRRLCLAIGERVSGRCAVFSGEGSAYRYAITQQDGDLRPVAKTMNEALHGRGGGKPNFVQGSVIASQAEIEAWFAVSGE